jgi:hypothetical protein
MFELGNRSAQEISFQIDHIARFHIPGSTRWDICIRDTLGLGSGTGKRTLFLLLSFSGEKWIEGGETVYGNEGKGMKKYEQGFLLQINGMALCV